MNNDNFYSFQKADKIYPFDRIIKILILWAIPYSIKPNHVTVLRFVITPFVAWLAFTSNYKVALFAFILAASTDAIDGAMARTRDQVTEWGKVYDPVADKILVGSMVFIIVLRYIDLWTAVLIMFLEAIIILTAWYRLHKGHKVQANVWGKIKMGLQVLGVGILLLAIAFNWADLIPYATRTLYLAIAFAIVSLLTYGI